MCAHFHFHKCKSDCGCQSGLLLLRPPIASLTLSLVARPCVQAAVDYRRALHLVQPPGASWEPPVLTCSAIERTGLAELWFEIERHRALMTETGERDERRREQKLSWMRTMLQERLLAHFDADPVFAAARADAEAAVSDGSLTPSVAGGRRRDRLGA